MSGLRDQLQAIYDQRGALTPRLVVDEARDEDHPLHASFEWDDAVAGEAWRLAQASHLIRSVKIIFRPATGGRVAGSVRAWQAVRGEAGNVYEPVEQVIADPILKQLVFRDMRREWQQLKARYDHFREFAEMVRADLAS